MFTHQVSEARALRAQPQTRVVKGGAFTSQRGFAAPNSMIYRFTGPYCELLGTVAMITLQRGSISLTKDSSLFL
jgi:hypothetical protein